MTLPASFPLSLSQVATELGLSLPLSINHAWVIALAGKSALPVSFSDLLGQTGSPNWNGTPTGSPVVTMSMSVPFFRGTTSSIGSDGSTPVQNLFLNFSVAPNWSGKILFKNTTTGGSTLLTKVNSTTWEAVGGGIGPMRSGTADNYTLSPSN